MSLKLSKTAIRELTRLYRGVLVAAIVATAVASTGAKAGTITDSESKTYTIVTNGTETGANANVIATYQAIEQAVTTAWNNGEAWIGQELGYDTTTTDAKTVLTGAGFTAQDIVGALTEVKGTADGAVQTANLTDKSLAIDAASLKVNGVDVLTAHQTIATGSANGTISVGGSDVAVKGLTDAAYATIQATLDSATTGEVADAKAVKDALDGKQSSTVSYSGTNYLDAATTLTGADVLLDTQVKANEDAITALTTNTSTGTINVSAANVGGAANVGSLEIGTTGKGIASDGKATVTALDAGSGKIETTGSLAAGDLSVIGASVFKGNVTVENGGSAKITLGTDGTITTASNATIGGTLKVGTAEVITGTAGTLNMGNNTLTGVKGMTLTDGTNTATLSVDANGFLTGGKNIDVGAGSLNSQTLNVGSSDQFTVDGSGNVITSGTLKTGAATVASITIGTTGKGIDNTGAATLTSVKIGDSAAATAIDQGTSAITSGNNTTLASTATVLTSAGNAAYSGTKVVTATSSTTLASAIDETTAALNNVLIATDAQKGLVDDAKIGVAWNSTDKTLEAVLGNGTYSTEYNIAKGDSMTTALSALDAAIGNRTITTTNTAVKTALATDVSTAVQTIGDQIGTASFTTKDSTGAVVADLTSAVNLLGDMSTLTGNAVTKGTGTEPTTISQALGNIDATLGTIHGLVADAADTTTTTSKAYKGNLAVGTTVEDHLLALDNAIGDRRSDYTNEYNIAKNQTLTESLDALDRVIGDFGNVNNANGNLGADVATSLDNLDAAVGDLNYTSTNYLSASDDNLTKAVSTLDSNLERVEGKVDNLGRRVNKMHHEMKSGFASLAAMSALVPNARVAGDTQIAVGTGYYRGTTGFAVGAFHHINDNVLLNAGASYGGNGAAVFKGGVTFGF